ncbi:hypothetical protein ABE501_20205 [Comamonas testosteroni]
MDASILIEAKNMNAIERMKISNNLARVICERFEVIDIIGGVSGEPIAEKKSKITKKINELDSKYFDINDAGGDKNLYMPFFCKARALSSYIYSLDADNVYMYCESVYEAQAACGGLENIRPLLFNIDGS